MSDEKKPDTIDLEKVFRSFEANTKSNLTLEHLKGYVKFDVTTATDEELTDVDTIQKSRVTYVVGLLKLLEYLRESGTTPGHKEAQAKLALGYVRHVEGNGLAGLQMGRTSGDNKFESEIAKLRSQVHDRANKRAKILKEAADNDSIN